MCKSDSVRGSAVTPPFDTSASVVSDAYPDGGDDTASLTIALSDDTFEVDGSYAAVESASALVVAGSRLDVTCSADRAVVYTIRGSGTFAGSPGTVSATLDRLPQAQLFDRVASGIGSISIVPTAGQAVGTLVAGQTYFYNAGGGVQVFSPPAASTSGSATVVISFVDVLDTDGDGVADDGDVSGSGTDAPCTSGSGALCDDNCPSVPNLDQADADGDGIGDACESSPAVPSVGPPAAIVVGLLSLLVARGTLGRFGRRHDEGGLATRLREAHGGRERQAAHRAKKLRIATHRWGPPGTPAGNDGVTRAVTRGSSE